MNGARPHPGDQMMAAFVDGTLAPDEIAYVADHLRDCSDCRIVVSETARFDREEQHEAPKKAAWPWWLAAAAVLALVAITVPLMRRQPLTDQLIAAAPPHHRLTEGRLSGFPWARVRPPSRGTVTPDPADLKLDGVAGEVLEKTMARTESGAQHARGLALLLVGRRVESIAALEKAARDSQDAKKWSDLAAARYTLAMTENRPEELRDARSAAERALQIDARSAEALFNHALIIEQLESRDEARAAWQKYLDVDASSDWSREARAHLAKLK